MRHVFVSTSALQNWRGFGDREKLSSRVSVKELWLKFKLMTFILEKLGWTARTFGCKTNLESRSRTPRGPQEKCALILCICIAFGGPGRRTSTGEVASPDRLWLGSLVFNYNGQTRHSMELKFRVDIYPETGGALIKGNPKCL